MAFGNRPVASFRQRTVYKTEFDIFKQNTDIDLISLLSFEDQPSKHFSNERVRPKTVSESKFRSREHAIAKGITTGNSSRSRVQSAYDREYKLNKKYQPEEREFKRRTWTKSETSIYKDFVKTSKTFIGQKRRATFEKKEQNVNRECKSALDIRNPSTEPNVRSQTTCGFHPNERNWIKSYKTNTKSNIETTNKRVKVERQINNKTEKSILNHIWRTRSAPTRAQSNKNVHSKRKESCYSDKFAVAESKFKTRPLSGWTEFKSEQILKPKERCFGSSGENSEQDAANSTVSHITIKGNGYNDDIDAVNVICESEVNDDNEKKNQTEWSTCEYVVNRHETPVAEKTDDNYDFIRNGKATSASSESYLNEDGACSKDSGFNSNAVTPELEFWNKSIAEDCKEDLNDDKHKRVKFIIKNPETDVNLEELDTCSAVSEKGNSVTLSDTPTETDGKESETAYDINDLISDLERTGANSRLSAISIGGQSNFTTEEDTDSLSGDAAQKALRELRKAEEQERAKTEEKKKEVNKPKHIESLIMSKEARHAIMETLHDMGTKKSKNRNNERDSADIRHKGVNALRRQTDNRNKYEYYMRERTVSYYKNHFKSIDSVGNEDNSSAYSSPREVKECDDTSSEEYAKGKLFPSIRENTKLSKATQSTSKSNILTLDQAKTKKYKIPGIGNYHLIASPDNDFEITPPGFDSRYNPRPIISKEEMEIPPRFIRERSIQKCKSWLTDVHLSPMSLRPIKKPK